jgi:hypothetical protein
VSGQQFGKHFPVTSQQIPNNETVVETETESEREGGEREKRNKEVTDRKILYFRF